MTSFHEELCGCFSDITVCLFGCFIPGGFMCQQAYAVDKASGHGAFIPYLLVCCLGCIGGGINRNKIREIYSMEGGILTDMIIWWCCGPCAGCQEYREVKRRKGIVNF